MRIGQEKFPLQENVYFLVYFKRLVTGTGVSLSFYVHEREWVKYDCQGPNGHFHIYLDKDQSIDIRRPFLEKDYRSQVDSSIRHFRQNVEFFLQGSPEVMIDKSQLDTILPSVREAMWRLQELHGKK